MLHRSIIWGAIVALLLMGSGAMQLAHDAAAHGVEAASFMHCEAAESSPIPVPQEERDCDICHLISHFSVTAPVAVLPPVPAEPVALVAFSDMQVTLAPRRLAAGPRAPPASM